MSKKNINILLILASAGFVYWWIKQNKILENKIDYNMNMINLNRTAPPVGYTSWSQYYE